MVALKSPVIARKYTLIVGDFLISLLSFYAGFVIRFYQEYASMFFDYPNLLSKALTFSFVTVFISFLIESYKIEKLVGRKELFLKILFTGVISFLVLAMFYYFIPEMEVGRGILLIAVCISIVVRFFCYLIYDYGLTKIPGAARRVLILGTGPVAKTMGNLFDKPDNSLALAGYVSFINEPVSVPDKDIIEHGNGNGETLLDIALKKRAHKIVVSLTEKRGTLPVKEVLNCKLKGLEVVDAPHFYEEVLGKLFIENVNPSHLIFSDGFKNTATTRNIKRIFDVFLAIISIVFSIPFLLIVPALIKAESRGPVLFKQARVGEGEKLFKIIKFRTMIDGAEKHTGPVWSQSGDNRITRVGKFLRKTRLDELPQLFNVLTGDMSFVGPRPERPFFIESLKRQIPYYSERHCVKPGVTGWAQVRYEYGDSIEDAMEKLKYDLYYIKYQSISLDLLIVLDTVKVVLFGKGGR